MPYYLKSSEDFFRKNFNKRLEFIEGKKFLFSEISKFINNCINNSKEIFLFCAGNSIISKNIQSEKINIREINENFNQKLNNKIYYKNSYEKKDIENCDHLVIADIEHQNNPTLNLLQLSKFMNDEARIIILSKNFFWMFVLNFLKTLLNFSPRKNNFLPSSYLSNLYSSCNLEIVRTERIIAFPVNIPIFTNFVNKLFRLPILNLFCVSSITILKKIQVKKENKNQEVFSFIIPCKNEEKNISLFSEKLPKNNKNYEFIFGDDNSSDNTKKEIIKLSKEQRDLKILRYDGPGVCKSENVYKGIDMANGDVIIIYDADLTVDFKDIEFALNILKNTNTDFINCTRMIYPQKNKAMKTLNFFGNGFFGFLFSVLFKKKITDTLCGTKIFYKKHWDKIKKGNGKWGAKDLWGDFDLLIGAYKNNLKITEVPVVYYERIEGETKMTSLFSNTIRMIWIVVSAYYKLRLKI